eukprot:4806271-Prymnesium_polylepis.1
MKWHCGQQRRRERLGREGTRARCEHGRRTGSKGECAPCGGIRWGTRASRRAAAPASTCALPRGSRRVLERRQSASAACARGPKRRMRFRQTEGVFRNEGCCLRLLTQRELHISGNVAF